MLLIAAWARPRWSEYPKTNSGELLSSTPSCKRAIYWVLLARLYKRVTAIASPVLFALYASRFPHQISVTLSSQAFSLSILTVQLTRR
jgi:hypothetical protein